MELALMNASLTSSPVWTDDHSVISWLRVEIACEITDGGDVLEEPLKVFANYDVAKVAPVLVLVDVSLFFGKHSFLLSLYLSYRLFIIWTHG